MTEQQTEEAFNALEDALVEGLTCDANGRVHVDSIQPLMEAARAVLMLHRGVSPIMPRRKSA